MSKSFLNGFLEQVKDTPIGRVALEYFTKHSHFEGFVFVEGSSDIDFYSQTLTDKINNEKIFEFYARFCNDGNYGYQCFAAVGSEGGDCWLYR